MAQVAYTIKMDKSNLISAIYYFLSEEDAELLFDFDRIDEELVEIEYEEGTLILSVKEEID